MHKKPWTLEACVKRALEMNISIKQSQLDYVNTEIEKEGSYWKFFTKRKHWRKSFMEYWIKSEYYNWFVGKCDYTIFINEFKFKCRSI